MSIEQKILKMRFTLADIGYIARRSDNGRHIVPATTARDRVELSLLKSRKIIRLHDDFPLYIESNRAAAPKKDIVLITITMVSGMKQWEHEQIFVEFLEAVTRACYLCSFYRLYTYRLR